MSQFHNIGLTSFYILPRILFEKDCPLSLEAKVLFSLILDRTDLSLKNEWRDKEGKIYVYYTVEEASEKLGYSKSKTTRIFKELEDTNYIRRKRQGLCKPNMVYINFRNISSGTSGGFDNARLETIREFYRSNNLPLPESFK